MPDMKPWIYEEVVDPLTDSKITVYKLDSVVLPEGWSTNVPYGAIFPIGGSVDHSTGKIIFPKGYYAKPISAASKESDSEKLDEMVAAYGNESVSTTQKIKLVKEFAHVLFDDYYGADVVNKDILPYLQGNVDTVSAMVQVAFNNDLGRIEISREGNDNPLA